MKSIWFTMIVLSVMSSAFSSSTNSYADQYQNKVCVLNFEVPGSPITALVDKIFGGAPNVSVHDAASPMDFVGCIKDRSTEIVVIGHALQTPASADGRKPVNLAYFRDLCGGERQEAISVVVESLSKQLDAVDELLERHPNLRSVGKAGSSPYTVKARLLAAKQKRYENYPEDEPYYVVRPILPKIMEVARIELKRQATQPGGVALKKIRLESCLPEQVLAQYDDLRALIEENGIQLDIAPANGFMSFWDGERVTSPDPDWLRTSIQTHR